MKFSQFLITGKNIFYPVPRISIFKKTKIFFITYKTLRLYKRKSATDSLNLINGLEVIESKKFSNDVIKYLYSRKVVSYAQLFVNLFRKKALCLERSVAVCASLRYLGIDAQLIIGRKNAANAGDKFEFHAWVEVDNKPINDSYSKKSLFLEMHRIPKEC